MKMKQILIPVSFTAASANSLQYAFRIGSKNDSKITLLHCYPLKEYSRKYNFGKRDYGVGIRKMLNEFYKEHATDPTRKPRIIAHAGSISDMITKISQHYDLIILSNNQTASNAWLTSKISIFTSYAKCPVLILPVVDKVLDFSCCLNVWHINRQANETARITKWLPEFGLDAKVINAKTFDQTTFKSAFWKKIVSYSISHEKKLLDEIAKSKNPENVDLVLLVNHSRSIFKNFLQGDVIQIFVLCNIPILVFPSRNPDHPT
jgi:nucleotide-binding universal stress UspA family protein